MHSAILRRYGFGYLPADNPPMVDKKGRPLYPEPTPLYGLPEPGAPDVVIEHGAWCLSQMLGTAANYSAVPPASVPGYIEREETVRSIMAERERQLMNA